MTDYKQIADLVIKEGDAILERKRRRAIMVKRVSLSASGLCAAVIVGLGVWHNNNIKNAIHHDDPSVITKISENTTVANSSIINSVTTQTETITNTTYTKKTDKSTSASTISTISDSNSSSNNSIMPGTTYTSESQTTLSSETIATTYMSNTVSTQNLSTITKNKLSSETITTTYMSNTVSTQNSSTITSNTTQFTSPISINTNAPEATTSIMLNSATTTTTSIVNDINKEYTYRLSFSLADETGMVIRDRDIDAKVLQQKRKKISDDKYEDDGEPVEIGTWNTLKSFGYSSQPITSAPFEYKYIIVVDKLPPGLLFYGKNSVWMEFTGFFNGFNNRCKVNLQRAYIAGTPDEVQGTFSLDVNILDYSSKESIGNLECEIYEKNTNKRISIWNTSFIPVYSINGLVYEFERNNKSEGSGKRVYCIRINNLPENLKIYNGEAREECILCGMNPDEFEGDSEIVKNIYTVGST